MSSVTSDAPLQQKLHTTTQEIALEAATKTVAINSSPFAGKVISAVYIPNAEAKGKATDFRTLKIINKGQKGEGNTVIAELALEAGKNIGAFNAGVIPLSETLKNLEVAEGDVLAFSSVLTGKGIVDPGGSVVVTIARS